MIQDVRLAIRSLIKSPLFAVMAIASLGLGIGANTAVFSLVDQVMWRQLPVREPERLVWLHHEQTLPGRSSQDSGMPVWSQPFYEEIARRNEVFSGVAVRSSLAVSVRAQDAGAERLRAEIVSGSFFPLLGVTAAAGRVLTEDDDRTPGGHPVAMLAYGYWKRRFGLSPTVLNQKLIVNGYPFTVVGVAPENLPSTIRGDNIDLIVPLAMQGQLRNGEFWAQSRTTYWLNILGRLKPGMSESQAEAGLAPLIRSLLERQAATDHPDMSARARERLISTKAALRPAAQGINDMPADLRTPMYALLVLVGLVLLITCINLANLLTVRAADRQREMAVRLAVGASRAALARQLLLEYVLLGAAGAVAGLLLGSWTLDALRGLAGPDAAFLSSRIDERMLAFNAAAALLSVGLFGLLPAWRAARADLTPALKDQGTGTGRTPAHKRFRQTMVFAQVAVSALLLVGAGLFARTLGSLRALDPGFRMEGLTAFSLDPALNGYSRERSQIFYDELTRRISSLPGVAGAAYAMFPPLENSSRGSDFRPEGYKVAEGADLSITMNYISPEYFRLLRIPVRGRAFGERDTAASPRVAIINEKVARDFFGDANPIGRRFHTGPGRADDFDIEIVGVAPTIKYRDLREKPQRMVYLPMTQQKDERVRATFLVDGGRDSARLGPLLRRAVAELDAGLPVYGMATMETVREERLASERLMSMLAGAFAALAALLSGMGLYGLLAYSVSRQQREFGIRMALGASPRDVVRVVLRDSALVVPGGLAAGLAGGYALGRFSASYLFGLQAWDPWTFGTALAALLAVAALAALAPARRAVRISPSSALRHE